MFHNSQTEALLAKALQSGATATDYNYIKANQYLKENAPDRRYKLFTLAGTCSWGHNEHGTIQYAGRTYRYQQYNNRYEVEYAPNYSRDLLRI